MSCGWCWNLINKIKKIGLVVVVVVVVVMVTSGKGEVIFGLNR